VLLAGVTVIVEPVPTSVPPQEVEYHFQTAPVPKDPPVTDKEVLAPIQSAEAPAVALVGATDSDLIVTTMLSVSAVQGPLASGSSVVSVNVTVPAAISAALNV
jgi:hypothetical protein